MFPSLTFLITLPRPPVLYCMQNAVYGKPHEERLPGACLKEGY